MELFGSNILAFCSLQSKHAVFQDDETATPAGQIKEIQKDQPI
jgi:hypothetical protein